MTLATERHAMTVGVLHIDGSNYAKLTMSFLFFIVPEPADIVSRLEDDKFEAVEQCVPKENFRLGKVSLRYLADGSPAAPAPITASFLRCSVLTDIVDKPGCAICWNRFNIRY